MFGLKGLYLSMTEVDGENSGLRKSLGFSQYTVGAWTTRRSSKGTQSAAPRSKINWRGTFELRTHRREREVVFEGVVLERFIA